MNAIYFTRNTCSALCGRKSCDMLLIDSYALLFKWFSWHTTHLAWLSIWSTKLEEIYVFHTRVVWNLYRIICWCCISYILCTSTVKNRASIFTCCFSDYNFLQWVFFTILQRLIYTFNGEVWQAKVSSSCSLGDRSPVSLFLPLSPSHGLPPSSDHHDVIRCPPWRPSH